MKRNWFSGLLLLFALLPFFAGCDLLDNGEEDELVSTGIYIANQGNFGDANGSVSIYDPGSNQVSSEAIVGFGAIIQSVAIHEDKLYVLANSADRIDIIDLNSLARTGQIQDIVSPRYMVMGPDNKAYVTSFYGAPGSFTGGMVSVVDLRTNTKIKEINVGSNPEGAAIIGNRLYVANYSNPDGFGNGNTLSVIDLDTDTLVDTLELSCDAPRLLIKDQQDELVALCAGQILYDENFNVVGETPGAILVLDGRTAELVTRVEIDGRIETSGPGQDAYYVPELQEIFLVQDSESILRFDTRTNTLNGQITGIGEGPVGAVAFDVTTDQLYVGHVPSFTERGTVTIHDLTGAQIDEFSVGVSPTFILIRHEEQ